MKNKIIIFGLFALLFVCHNARAEPVSPVFISQVQITGGKDNTNQDFVELFNPSAVPVNLKGYRLVKRAASSQSDTLIKSWSKDSFIPAKSFYLWANSGFVSIAVKPDAVSSATVSADSGVALRFGANNSGAIVASIAWGKTNNAFFNVSATNPGGGQAIIKKDLQSSTSAYYISAGMPHNSLVNDLTAAFAQRQPPQKTFAVIPKQVALGPSSSANLAAIATAAPENLGRVEGESTINTGTSQNSAYFYSQNSQIARKPAPIRYLILSGMALLALIFLVWRLYLSEK